MEKAIPIFLQYGAMGIMAIGFIVLLILFVRSDKRAAKYAAALEEASFDRSQLITVVKENTKVITALVTQFENSRDSQAKMSEVMGKLETRLESGQCPFISENRKGR